MFKNVFKKKIRREPDNYTEEKSIIGFRFVSEDAVLRTQKAECSRFSHSLLKHQERNEEESREGEARVPAIPENQIKFHRK